MTTAHRIHPPKSRVWSSLIVGVVLSVAFAACGDSANNENESTTTVEDSSATTSGDSSVTTLGGGAATTLAEPASMNVKFNVTFRSGLYTDLYVAIAKGFFEAENVNVELLSSPMPNPAILLLTGDANMISGWAGMSYLLNAEGADLRGVYSPADVYEAWVADPQFTSPSDLVGQDLGVFTLQDLDVIYTRRMMEQFGIAAEQYSIVPAGISPEKVAAVSAGQVAAAPIYPPSNFLATELEGLVEIFSTAELEEAVPSMYVVSDQWASANADAVTAVIRGLNRAHDWLFDASNRDEAISILIEYTEMDPEVADDTYELYFQTPGNYSEHGEWTDAQIENTGRDLVAFGMLTSEPVPIDEVADRSYLENALNS